MYGDILNLDGWAGRGMSVELLKEKVDILHAHCEAVGRDPAEIKIHRPDALPADQRRNRRQSVGRARRTRHPQRLRRQKSSQRIGEFKEFGINEVMFGRRGDNDPDYFQQLDEEVISHFT